MTATEAATLPALTARISADVDEQTYRQDQRALSQSDMKLILKSPAHYRWQVDHPPKPKKAFDFGTAAHKRVLGVGAELVVHEYDTTKVKSPKATKVFKEQQEKVRSTGGVLLLPDEFDQVLAMETEIRKHRLAMELLAEGEAEVSAYGQDPETGIWIKGRFDWLGPELILDYKTAASSDPDVFVRKAPEYGYDLQAAVYLDLAAASGHPATGFAHLVQESEPPYVVSVVVLPAELIDRGRVLKRRALERYRDCVEVDRWPGYIPDNTFATPAAPLWALRDVADEIQL